MFIKVATKILQFHKIFDCKLYIANIMFNFDTTIKTSNSKVKLSLIKSYTEAKKAVLVVKVFGFDRCR